MSTGSFAYPYDSMLSLNVHMLEQPKQIAYKLIQKKSLELIRIGQEIIITMKTK